jgi:hypothetical protein
MFAGADLKSAVSEVEISFPIHDQQGFREAINRIHRR